MIRETSKYAHLFLWCGPVTASNLKSVRWQVPTTVLTIGSGIGSSNPIGSDAFANLGRSLASPKLPNLIRARGFDPESFDAIGIGSFSAGHGLVNELFKDEASLDWCWALGAFDSYYGKAIKQGYLAFCRLAAEDNRLAVLTTSEGKDPNVGTSRECIAPLAQALDFAPTSLPEGIAPPLAAPSFVEGRGSATHAHWTKYTHVQHATVVAPVIIERMISPWMAGQRDTSAQTARIVGRLLG